MNRKDEMLKSFRSQSALEWTTQLKPAKNSTQHQYQKQNKMWKCGQQKRPKKHPKKCSQKRSQKRSEKRESKCSEKRPKKRSEKRSEKCPEKRLQKRSEKRPKKRSEKIASVD